MNFLTAFLLMIVLSQETPLVQKLPDGTGAWTLDVITTGGFDGMGIGKYAVNSNGMLTCASTKRKCPNKLSATALKRLTEQVKAAVGVPWEGAIQRGMCSDCVTVRLQLTLRQPDGSIKTFITSWDTATTGVPEPLRTLFNTVTDIGRKPNVPLAQRGDELAPEARQRVTPRVSVGLPATKRDSPGGA